MKRVRILDSKSGEKTAAFVGTNAMKLKSKMGMAMKRKSTVKRRIKRKCRRRGARISSILTAAKKEMKNDKI